MESKAGSMLTLIGGILTLAIALIFLLIGLFILQFASLSDKLGQDISMKLMLSIFTLIFFYLLVGGVLKIHASHLMKNKKTVMKGGILAIILGIFVPEILSLIGGIIAIVQGTIR